MPPGGAGQPSAATGAGPYRPAGGASLGAPAGASSAAPAVGANPGAPVMGSGPAAGGGPAGSPAGAAWQARPSGPPAYASAPPSGFSGASVHASAAPPSASSAPPFGVPAPAPAGFAPPASVPPAGGGTPAAPISGATTPGYPEKAPRRLAWPGVVALTLVAVLIAVAVLQALQINQLSDRLAEADRRNADAQSSDDGRLRALEDQTAQLAAQAGKVFNPEAVATAVLPSVFRVKAGNFLGTAFAVGKPATGGGANLFTNFHVVESVWKAGGREVQLERQSDKFTATIVEVDEENDLAHLRTSEKISGLVVADKPVKSGQQIIVVGSPLGLSDSVTTGVVSAFRNDPDGAGTVIQFDAPINPGNSGGPVINGEKKVVGIATAKARDAEGIGLAVPIGIACDSISIC
ncbi:trypsin-like peptidase domain-containing protein [Rhizomonospora bruguierae]